MLSVKPKGCIIARLQTLVIATIKPACYNLHTAAHKEFKDSCLYVTFDHILYIY